MINWILQKNITKPEVLDRIKDCLQREDESWEEIKIIPFSKELPPLKRLDAFNVIYGSTTFMINAFNNKDYHKGVFYNPEKFQVKNYVDTWGSEVLNSDGRLIKLSEFKAIQSPDNQKWFIRPNHDSKEFGGRLGFYKELREWINKIIKLDLPDFNSETEIWYSSPKEIEKEWRLFVVDNKIISASKYMEKGELNTSEKDIPESMLNFAKKLIDKYFLSEVYVMDIAKVDNSYKLIECNCFNGTGFYDHDIELIVSSVNEMIRRKFKTGA